jgi:hypothetical protein
MRTESRTTPTRTVQKNSRFRELQLIYIFAHKYDIPQLRRDMRDKTIEYQFMACVLPSMTAVAVAYEALPSTSLWIKFLVACYAYKFYPQSSTKNDKFAIAPGFLRDVAMTCMSSRDDPHGMATVWSNSVLLSRALYQ